MPGPIQSGISGVMNTALAGAVAGKHLKEEQAQTAEQKATKEEVAKNTALQNQLAEEAEKKAELQYKADITKMVKDQEQKIFDEESQKASENILKVLEKHPNRSELEEQQWVVYGESQAIIAGKRAMHRIEQLTKSDPFRQIQLAYAKGEIANRNEYEQKMQKEYLRPQSEIESVDRGLHKFMAEQSPDKRR